MTRFEDIIGKAGMDAEPLTAEERARMRSLLLDYAAFTPARVAAPRRARAFSGILMRPAFAAALSFALLATTSGAVAYAAEGAVPGDLLYPVKVSVTEPVVTALTPSGKAEAAWQATIAKRRLGEAATLSAEGRLASSTAATLAARAADATFESARAAAALSVEATTTASTTANLEAAARFLAEGERRLKSHDNADAAEAFTAAIHAAALGVPALGAATTTLDLRILDRDTATSTEDEDANAATTPGEAATPTPEGGATTTPADVDDDAGHASSTATTTASTTPGSRLRSDRDGGGSGFDIRLHASTTLRLFDRRD